MNLPVSPPIKPMLAKLVSTIPAGMFYEPKFDGFRCIMFRDGAELELGSRNERPLTRYFPEIAAAAINELPVRCVLDGEIIVAAGKGLDFEALQQRIHPAASRVGLLARETPASFVAFDLLALGEDSFLERRFLERRAALQVAFEGVQPPFFVSPLTSSVETAEQWFKQFEGAGLDGVIAKPGHIKYVPDRRLMFKIKHERTADCVVAGFRWHKSGPVVGSLLLGLYDGSGGLQHVGVAASFSMARRQALVDELATYRWAQGESHPWAMADSYERIPGGDRSRWNRDKDMSWEPLRPELVAEVAYDHMEGDRFRHVTFFKRWRPDREPESCTFEQLDRPATFDLKKVLSSGAAG